MSTETELTDKYRAAFYRGFFGEDIENLVDRLADELVKQRMATCARGIPCDR